MLGRCVWLWVTVMSAAVALAVPKGSSKRELQQLVRLPRVEFGTPLDFHRRFGFVAFPDEGMAAAAAAQLAKKSEKGAPDPFIPLQAARIFDRQGDSTGAMRQYSRAIDLLRKRLEVSPEEIRSLAGLGEALTALGRYSEAQAVLDRARTSSDMQLWLACVNLYRERAWFAAAGEAQRFGNGSFLDQLVGVATYPPEPRAVEESKRFLRRAEEALNRVFEADASTPAAEEERLLARAAFRSFQSAMETAYSQIQGGELRSRSLRNSVLTEQALHDLIAAAEMSDDPEVIVASALAASMAGETLATWASENGGAEVYVRRVGNRLQGMIDERGENASEAAEFLGCVQLQVLKDARGAERSFRKALQLEPGRHRSWELLTLAAVQQGPERFVEVAEERAEALPHPRSSVLLVKSYERQGNTLRAEWTALNAAGVYPNDWLVNLSLAAMLLKDENAESFLWRVDEALKRAEKALGANPKRQQRLDLVLVKSVFLAMSDQAEEARKLVEATRPLTPELQEVLRVLGQ
jgi:tetratricopeptide (TPR) repeat protein